LLHEGHSRDGAWHIEGRFFLRSVFHTSLRPRVYLAQWLLGDVRDARCSELKLRLAAYVLIEAKTIAALRAAWKEVEME